MTRALVATAVVQLLKPKSVPKWAHQHIIGPTGPAVSRAGTPAPPIHPRPEQPGFTVRPQKAAHVVSVRTKQQTTSRSCRLQNSACDMNVCGKRNSERVRSQGGCGGGGGGGGGVDG
ncbi:hypothetical protein ANO11243_067240 [Dothideomycetidae sp. 11243]|nr:hypothetical protein ANO11243_067240 [fungal sp. No.11243]